MKPKRQKLEISTLSVTLLMSYSRFEQLNLKLTNFEIFILIHKLGTRIGKDSIEKM